MDAPGFTASLVAGGVAGVSVDLILFPLDTIKTRLQSPQGFNKAGGFRGIYAGVPSAAVGSFPNAAAFFLTYEYVKSLLHTDSTSHFKPVKHMLAASTGEVALWAWRRGHVVDSWQSAVCGAFAGGFAAAVTTPLDVAKTRIMLAKAGSSTAVGNVLSAMHGVWRSQGLAGLFAGVLPRMAAISMGGFIFLGAYDQARSLLLEVGRKSP
ncbi:mitochondrial S-adenosylmethionine carrier protein isoform X3 [Mus musculus]|uniref:mitochondrial S-adenosylmethionine carrier protein isoform X3 n=1 Tax=Mus musculus TaxID=10090 RepID=UPI0003D78243|nr:S-adenosylmethionine mitochondrial carrier protein isoform X3 [Mus musculus]|eukprot:XP_006506582.1 PREDICTED: S-adenosylmethionine mitochondrial carrier protein isoform X3 [Mus musculus]